MTLIQTYLRQNPLESLTTRFAIHVNRHARYSHLVMLKYSQRNSPFEEPLVRECRGIILDESRDWAIVSRPYDKFFNFGEPHAAAIDWSTARVYEKLDGSLMTLYYYASNWHVASSGTPDAGGNVNDAPVSFADLFWQVWRRLNYALPTDTSRCYMFELMTPLNRVVVPHAGERIVLHGARETSTGKEFAPAQIDHAWESVQSFALSNIDDVLTAAAALKPMESEGYVVCDAAFNRIKIKSPRYVAIALLKEGFGRARMLELARSNEGDELLAYFPELRVQYESVKAEFDAMLAAAKSAYEPLRDLPTKKEFAMAAMKTPYAPILFALRDGKAASVEDFLRTAALPAIERLLNP